MTLDEFWTVVQRVHEASGGNMDAKCKLLADELRKLPPDEVIAFNHHFTDRYFEAHAWDLWAAVYMICGGGCSDDSFMDFRSTLVSFGRKTFESALANPDSLSELELNRESATYEGYQYVPSKVYEEKMGGAEMPPYKSHPKRPRGLSFNDWELSKQLPKLAAKYNWKDPEKPREPSWKRRIPYVLGAGDAAERTKKPLASLLLDAGIVSTGGVIPPFAVVATVIARGSSAESTGVACSWQPFKLEQGDYWPSVAALRQMTPLELEKHGRVGTTKIIHDFVTPPQDDYQVWLQSLANRKLIAL